MLVGFDEVYPYCSIGIIEAGSIMSLREHVYEQCMEVYHGDRTRLLTMRFGTSYTQRLILGYTSLVLVMQ